MLASIGFFTSCEKNPIDSEQYKKMVYIVGSPDVTKRVELKYSTEPQETFISVSTSGSLDIEKDVDVKLFIKNDAVVVYNEKYFGPSKLTSYFRILKNEFYSIPNLDKTTIVASEGIYKRIPVFINTEKLHTDSSYVIPISIESVSNYELNEELSTLILTFNLVNNYSANYSMEGRRIINQNATRIQKNKILRAVDEHTLRMYWADGNETNDALISTNTLTLKVNPDNSISIDAWKDLAIIDGGGTYNPEKKEFSIWYTLTDKGTLVRVEETLQRIVIK